CGRTGHDAAARYRLAVVDGRMYRLVRWGGREVGASAAAHLVAGFDGRSHTDFGADSRCNHGDGWHLHGGALLARLRALRYGLVPDHCDRCDWRIVPGYSGRDPKRH